MTELSHRDKSHTGGSDCAALNPSGKDVPKKDREDLLKGLAMDREDLLTDEGLADSQDSGKDIPKKDRKDLLNRLAMDGEDRLTAGRRYKGKSEELWKDLHAAAEWEVR